MKTKLVSLLAFCVVLSFSQFALAQYMGGSFDGYAMGTSASDILFNQNIYVGGSYDGYAMGTSVQDISLPVVLSSFTARAGDGEITLSWITESEMDNLGFHVYRALAEDGTYQRLTADPIEGAGTSTSRRGYRFTDVRLTNGVTYWYKIEAIAFDGTTTVHGPIYVTPQKTQALPTEFRLSQNVPNPFNPATEIRYQLPKASHVELAIYNMLGRKVQGLVDGFVKAGYWSVAWDAEEMTSGIYFVQMKAGDFFAVRKMVLIR